MIRLYLDEDVHKKLAVSLRLKGYDVLSAHEVKNSGSSDVQQLEYAVSEGRAIFTFNNADFSRLHKEYLEKGKSHFGILLSKQIPLSENISRLTRFLFGHKTEDIMNGIFWI
ncbi:MAG: DUF5615 family PIN-like protein [Thermodesulfovibrionales bacterium]|nr:DUF5615 family PIN-like protein [Thermodesulfovibrionales bacterium]